MLKTYPNGIIVPTPVVFDLEFEGRAVGTWRRNLGPENESFMGLPYYLVK